MQQTEKIKFYAEGFKKTNRIYFFLLDCHFPSEDVETLFRVIQTRKRMPVAWYVLIRFSIIQLIFWHIYVESIWFMYAEYADEKTKRRRRNTRFDIFHVFISWQPTHVEK